MNAPDPLGGWRFAAIVALILAATSAPYVAWWMRTPPGHTVVACNFINRGDTYAYIAWMKQAAQGHLLFLNLYDPAPQERTLFHPFFLLLGWVARATGAPLAFVYHLGRAAASLWLLVAARRFCRSVFGHGDGTTRAFFLLTAATGLPALVPSSPVVAMFDVALHALAWALILEAGTHWLRACTDGARGRTSAALAGLAGAGLVLVHPFDAVSFAVVVLATSVVAVARGVPRRAAAARLLIVAAVMAPAAALVGWSVLASPSLHAWAGHPRVTHLPHLLAFATLPLLAGASLLGPPRPATPFLLTWAATTLGLALAPVPSNQKFLLGIQAPLALLAADGVEALRRRGFPRIAKYLLILAFPVAALMLLIDGFDLLPTVGPRFQAQGLVQDIRRLETLPPGIILAPFSIAHFIPAYAGRQVYLGHFDMTPDAVARNEELRLFIEGKLDGSDLAARGIRYVVLYLETPDQAWPGLELRATGAETRLYEVKAEPPGPGDPPPSRR